MAAPLSGYTLYMGSPCREAGSAHCEHSQLVHSQQQKPDEVEQGLKEGPLDERDLLCAPCKDPLGTFLVFQTEKQLYTAWAMNSPTRFRSLV